jgi:HAD superfamily hydrolase (TIGR01484 family)
MKTHLFFDLDNTVTRSRTKITTALKEILTNTKYDVIVVSGATCTQIAYQMDDVPCYKLGQNGNHAINKNDNTLWEERLNEVEKVEIMKHIESLPRTWEVIDEKDLVQDRGCQISYSLLGHHEIIEKKEEFDPQSNVRKDLLEKHPFQSETLEVKIGGTTCLDYTAKGKHKGYYVAKLIEKMNWNKDECIYFGDMLFPGGNDETVVGVIDTQAVKNPEDTLEILLKKYIS